MKNLGIPSPICVPFMRFWRCERAVAAVETALIMPVLIAMMLTSIDALHYFRAMRQLSLNAETVAALMAEGQSNFTPADIEGIFRAAELGSEMPAESSITVTVFTSDLGATYSLFDYSKNFLCPAPFPFDKIAAYVEGDGLAVVASACMNFQPMMGAILGFSPQSIEQFAIYRAKATGTIECDSC